VQTVHTQTSEKIDTKLTDHLGEGVEFFDCGPVNEAIGHDPNEGGGGGSGDGRNGDNGDGTYTARSKEDADRLLMEGYQENSIIDRAKARAGIEGYKQFKTASYNNSPRIHQIETALNNDPRDMDAYDLDSFKGVPGVHYLINDIESSMDLHDQQKCATFFLGGQTNISKTAIIQSVVASLFGQGVLVVNTLEQIARHASSLKPDVPLLMDDMSFAVTVNGSLASLESVKGLFEQKNSTACKEVMCRSGKNSEIAFDVIKCGTSQWSKFEEMYNGSDMISVSIPENQLAAIAKRCNFRHVHEYHLPSGEWVDLCPKMTPFEKERFMELGHRVCEYQRWPLHFVAGMPPHPNATQPWAFARDGGVPSPLDDDMQPRPDPEPEQQQQAAAGAGAAAATAAATAAAAAAAAAQQQQQQQQQQAPVPVPETVPELQTRDDDGDDAIDDIIDNLLKPPPQQQGPPDDAEMIHYAEQFEREHGYDDAPVDPSTQQEDLNSGDPEALRRFKHNLMRWGKSKKLSYQDEENFDKWSKRVQRKLDDHEETQQNTLQHSKTLETPVLEKRIETRIVTALEKVESEVGQWDPGISPGMKPDLTTAKVKSLVSHREFDTVAGIVSSAFEAAEIPFWWKAETRDELVCNIAGKIPELGNYFGKHMVRSSACVFELDPIKCAKDYYNMSNHNDAAITLLEKAKVTPHMIIEGLRAHTDLGTVNSSLFPDDDMLLELAICQTWTIFDEILIGKLPVYDLRELSNFDAIKEIYSPRPWSEQGVGGIAHASKSAYVKLEGKLKPDTSVGPLQFNDDTAKAQWFLKLMKALLLSRVIAKTPLKYASDIHALEKSMNAFKDKGYKGKDLVKLLIVTHRLWTPKRMGQFARNILPN